ncbi:MAG: GHKL domain-containing protein, partial [Myxococcales bacterium]|nr:GHKL domain-containing protein [Myxococcales bacterium]
IAHEIKNPLSPIQLSIETLRKTRAQRNPAFDEIFDESTRTVLEEVERLRRIVSEFSEFARMPRPQPSDVDVREVVEHVVRLVQPDGPDPEVRLEGDRSRVVRADRGQLVQVFMNLVKNGLEAARQMRGAGSAAVVIRIEPHVDGVTVHVDDNGVGIPEAERARVFDPYHSTKVGGSGLGLSVVARVVEEHGGHIEIASAPLGGARVSVFLSATGPALDAALTAG